MTSERRQTDFCEDVSDKWKKTALPKRVSQRIECWIMCAKSMFLNIILFSIIYECIVNIWNTNNDNLGNSIQSSGSWLFRCLTMKFCNVGLSNVWMLSWLSVANFIKTVHIPSEGGDLSMGFSTAWVKSSKFLTPVFFPSTDMDRVLECI